jgi:enoyl-[acyl-carrier protein] reductase / trans-2-enoyl-CoA reductase (NAD+)
MPTAVINPRIRGFICITAHPDGCAANVRSLVDLARRGGPGKGLGTVLVVGSSTGYGLASLTTAMFGWGADAVGVCFERPANGDKPGSAGFYNLAEVHRQAAAAGRRLSTINGDAFSDAVKQQTIAALRALGSPVDLVVYSLASPKRKDPASDTVWSSVLKPLGDAYTAKTVDLDSDAIKDITLPTASADERANTIKVMGGEDWTRWMDALAAAGVLAPTCRTVAYSYIGPKVTHPIYRAGTIGAAKDHLEATGRALHARLSATGGGAWVSVNKALVTQASSAIPVVPLYIALLFKVMKARGSHEDTGEQIVRLFADHLAPGRTPRLDDQQRIRLDDRELDPAVQAEVDRLWGQVTTENLRAISDYDGFKVAFRRLFGFEVPGVDYAAPVEVSAALA